MDAITAPAPTFLNKAANAAQWAVFGIIALFAVIIATDLHKLDVPDAPITLLIICIGVWCGLALIHLPMIFRRLPRRARWAAYLAILPALVLFGNYTQSMGSAYELTPAGAREAAARAEDERKAAARQAELDAQAKAERDAAAQSEREQQQEASDAKTKTLCESLQPNVIDLSKEGVGPEVIEINNIDVGYSAKPTELKCTGTAVTSNGDHDIEFGIRRTPQGKDLVTMRLR